MPNKTSKTPEEHEAADNGMEGRGRAANRRDAKTFDVFALELIELRPDKMARLPVTEELRRTLHNAVHTKAKAARRRHLRKLAGMLRTSPAEHSRKSRAKKTTKLSKLCEPCYAILRVSLSHYIWRPSSCLRSMC